MYIYAPLPFMVLGTMYALASFKSNELVFGIKIFYVFVAIALVYSSPDYISIDNLSINDWTPIKIHNIGKEIGNIMKNGRVLTLEPIYPLETHLETYEEFTVSPFAYRSAHLLPETKRKKLKLVSEDDLEDLLKKRPPDGILTGLAKDSLEAPFIKYADEKGFIPMTLSEGKVLWVRKNLSGN